MTHLTSKIKNDLDNVRIVEAGSLPWQVAVPARQPGRHVVEDARPNAAKRHQCTRGESRTAHQQHETSTLKCQV